MRRETGQSLVEAVVALPLCLACALALVDCGVIVRDRVAIAQAATRAAEAHLAGGDEIAAARSALPGTLARTARVTVHARRVEVSASSGVRVARLAGATVTQQSSATFEVPEASR